jgi:hypothetical protein
VLRCLLVLFIARREFLIRFPRSLLNAVNVYGGGGSVMFVGIPIPTVGTLLFSFPAVSDAPFLVAKLDQEKARLELEEERTQEVLQEAAARLARLRKQRKLLEKRGSDMLRRGLANLEELEEEERREEEEKVRAEQQRVASPSSPGFVFDGGLSSFPDLLDFGASGEIAQPGPSSSSGS